MNAVRPILLLATLWLPATPTVAQLVTYEMVTVGDPGNGNDGTGHGAVAYEYQIGKYEVTVLQYATFLNAVAKADPNGLYRLEMAVDRNVAGITQSGTNGSFLYDVTGPFGVRPAGADSAGNRPMTHVSWRDAARFANWMANGQPTGPQGPATTENGAYDLVNAASGTAPAVNATNPNTGAAPLYRIPTENEWYKAAYFKGGGTNTGYWAYATQSNTAPGNTIGGDPNQANFYAGDYAVTQSPADSSSQNYLTNVGAFTGSASAYGTFDQNGNAWEWNDLAGAAGLSRGLRGGGWDSGSSGLSSSGRFTFAPTARDNLTGFRLASPVVVPEPSTWVVGFGGLACAAWSAVRRRRTR